MAGMDPMLTTLLIVFVASVGYAGGRLHQWYRTGLDRDEAYREGYDTATRSTLSLAARVIAPRRERVTVRASARVPDTGGPVDGGPGDGVPEDRGLENGGRHTVPEELVRAATYRLTPDRVARAKVRPPAAAGDGAEPAPAAVPKPRSC
jgi:hypothetical protein